MLETLLRDARDTSALRGNSQWDARDTSALRGNSQWDARDTSALRGNSQWDSRDILYSFSEVDFKRTFGKMQMYEFETANSASRI